MTERETFYGMGQLALMTGLTDRTLRSYLASGLLQGEKVDGSWRFTPEQVEALIRHPAVRPSILAKHNGLVYDFLLNTGKPAEELCVILDIPGGGKQETADFFCREITGGGHQNLRFFFDGVGKGSRVILTGEAAGILGLLNAYSRSRAPGEHDSGQRP